jgi:hypothetical protein
MGLSGSLKTTHRPHRKEMEPYVMKIACHDLIDAFPGFGEKLGCLINEKA